jgi:DNA-binding HxlR family transcriptional regulator
MLENIVDVLIDKVKKEVITDENMQNIPLDYLITRNIPDSVKHFFNQEVELWIREEEEKFTSNERFDYDMPEVRMHIDNIFDLLKQSANFHITKFNQLLERAVKLEMNFLIEPQRTLTQFLFKDSPLVSTMEVYDTMKFFFRYNYYKDAISDYFNTKYLREISQDQFKDLMEQIDEKIYKDDMLETTLKTLKTVCGFVNEALEEETEVISIDVLEHAFSDHKLETYADLIKQLKEADKSEISLTDLEPILSEGNIQAMDQAEKDSSKREATQIMIENLEDIESSKPEVEVSEIDLKEPEVIEEEPEEELEEEIDEEDEEIEETKESKKAPETVAAEETVTEESPQEGKVADDLADFVADQIKSDQPMEDVNKIITGRNRKKVVKKLFKKKENEFNSFVEILNTQNTWKDASVIIDEEFYQRGINPYSKEAILFSDMVYTRFFPKDKYVGEQEDFDKF